jgi:vacuolar-type H+-ATPase subunit H
MQTTSNNRAASPDAKRRVQELLEKATRETQEALRDAFRPANKSAKQITLKALAKERRRKQIAEMKTFSASLKMPEIDHDFNYEAIGEAMQDIE